MTKTDLQNRIDDLPLEGKKLFVSKIRQSLALLDDSNSDSRKGKLVAYVKGRDGFDVSELNSFLGGNLPDFMMPSRIVPLDRIPVLPNGKVDKRALLKLGPNRHTSDVFAEENPVLSKTEATLKAIWEEVLNFSPIDVHDNFFEIGGDSILSIQITARSRAAGIRLRPNQIFDHQTIAELAMFALEDNAEVEDQDVVEGELPLTPIQHWFFDTHKVAPHHWNQIVAVSGLNARPMEAVKEVFVQLLDHHAALRQSFALKEGTWRATLLKQGDAKAFHYFDLSEVDDTIALEERIRQELKTTQENLDLSAGGLFMGLYFDCGENRENRFFMVAHHLVVDMVSWNILFGDFRQGIEQRDEVKKSDGKGETVSYTKWAHALPALANSPELADERAYWKSQVVSGVPFPTDFKIDDVILTEGSTRIHQSGLDVKHTEILQHQANKAYNTRIEDILITVLFNTLSDWGGFDDMVLGLERHGRTIDLNGFDVSNTVGWFTSFFPLALERTPDREQGSQLVAVKEKLRAIPNDGIGYGLLNYLSNDGPIEPKAFEYQVLFNYLGVQHRRLDTSEVMFDHLFGNARDRRSERTCGLELNAFIAENVLKINWGYAIDLYKESTIVKLASEFDKNLLALLEHCCNAGEGKYTPSDFPEADLSQEDLDNLMNQFK